MTSRNLLPRNFLGSNMREEFRKYWCHNCRSKVDNPKWIDVRESVAAAHCPHCNEEVARKLKIK